MQVLFTTLCIPYAEVTFQDKRGINLHPWTTETPPRRSCPYKDLFTTLAFMVFVCPQLWTEFVKEIPDAEKVQHDSKPSARRSWAMWLNLSSTGRAYDNLTETARWVMKRSQYWMRPL